MARPHVDSGGPTSEARRENLGARLLDTLLEGCQLISRDFRYLYVNQTVAEQARSRGGALLGRKMTDCFPGIDQTPMFAELERCMRARTTGAMENRFVYPDGSDAWFELRFEPVEDGIMILSVDVTERKRVELALRRTMGALATLSECNRALVHAREEQGLVAQICRSVVDTGGYQAAWVELGAPGEAGGWVARAGVAPAEAASERFERDVVSGGEVLGRMTICSDGLSSATADERALLGEIVDGVGHGVRALRARLALEQTQQELTMARRLEAVGRLAGGVAHDFNNLLSVILNCSTWAAEALEPEHPARQDILQVKDAGERAADLTRQLLAFSRKQVLAPRITNVNRLVSGVERMLERVLPEDIDMQVHLRPDLGNVRADPGQIEQVLMNLVVNARDAMPDGGKLTVETREVELDGSLSPEHESVPAGAYVQLSVADTGTGMSEETRSRIFEPFFTTKEVGKGTGLGLATVYGIVKQSGGSIWVYSELGLGTTFKVLLPRVEAVADLRPPAPVAAAAKGGEAVLVVEDHPAVRATVVRILESAGYRVVAAGSGEEARARFRAAGGAFQIVVTDVVMPGLSGPDLVAGLQAEDPSLRVLFTSGYSEHAVVHQGILEAGAGFISKPYSAAALTLKVREVLDAPAAPPPGGP